jgi:hypothetical protein
LDSGDDEASTIDKRTDKAIFEDLLRGKIKEKMRCGSEKA